MGTHNIRGALAMAAAHDVSIDGAPQSNYLQSPRVCNVIGAPMQFGQPFIGTDTGPRLLRDAGLRKVIAGLGWRFHDSGDVKMDAKSLGDACRGMGEPALGGLAHHCAFVGEANARLFRQVSLMD